MGLHFVVGAMFWSALIGAIMAVWVLVMKGKLWWGVRRSFRHAIRLGNAENDAEPTQGEDPQGKNLRIPYGTAIAFGSLVAFLLPVLFGTPVK